MEIQNKNGFFKAGVGTLSIVNSSGQYFASINNSNLAYLINQAAILIKNQRIFINLRQETQ